MRKLKLQVQLTIDGFMSGPNGEMDWMKFPWTPDIEKYVTELTNPIDCIVLGRKLAEGFIPHWAGVAAQPENPEHAAGQKFTNTPKVVFTQSLTTSPWANTVLAKGKIVEEIGALKQQKGGDIIAYGGGQFVGSLLQNKLIDELHLFINPAVIGSGLSFFSVVNGKQNFDLISTTPFDCGIVALTYIPV